MNVQTIGFNSYADMCRYYDQPKEDAVDLNEEARHALDEKDEEINRLKDLLHEITEMMTWEEYQDLRQRIEAELNDD